MVMLPIWGDQDLATGMYLAVHDWKLGETT
jgi:hypothetical protein